MKKIGVLFGQENTFPGALVERINSMEIDGVRAEFVQVGGVEMAKPCPYAVIVDRISHDMPFYRAYLKNAALTGTKIVNNPFWWSADDKFFNYALAEKLGVAVPRTALLPHKMFPPDITAKSLRNLQYPLNWQEIFDYVKFPAFLKPHDGGGWRDVFHVHNPQELFDAYDQSRDLCMTLQAAVKFKEYFRCYVVGQEKVHIMPYDPSQPHHLRYVQNPPAYDPALLARVEKDALTLCRALGYDLNTVEFAVEDGIPYAIDFMNPAPDADRYGVGEANFEWIVDAVAKLAVKKAHEFDGTPMGGMNWSGFLKGDAPAAPVKKPVIKKVVPAVVKKAAVKKSPAKRQPGSNAMRKILLGLVVLCCVSGAWGQVQTPMVVSGGMPGAGKVTKSSERPRGINSPVPVAITAGHKLFLSNGGADAGLFPHPFTGTQDRAYAAMYKLLSANPAYILVGSPAEAELVLELQLTAPAAAIGDKKHGTEDPLPVFKLTVYDRPTHYTLWVISQTIDQANLQKTHDRNFDDALTLLGEQFALLKGVSQ